MGYFRATAANQKSKPEPILELLWTNPEPMYSRGFETQTINIPNVNDYEYFIIDCKNNCNETNSKFHQNFVPKTANSYRLFGVDGNNNYNSSQNTKVTISDNNFTFTVGNAYFCIPLRIFGVKYLNKTEGELQQQVVQLEQENQRLLEIYQNEIVNLDLIWTNPYPNHVFVSRTLNLPQIEKYNYEYFVIDVKSNFNDPNNKFHKNFIAKNTANNRIFGVDGNNNYNGNQNSFVTNNNNNFTFTMNNDNYCIPLRIYGITRADADDSDYREEIQKLEELNQNLLESQSQQNTMTLLWSNPEPNYSRGFETQTLRIPYVEEHDFKYFVIDCKNNKSDNGNIYHRNFVSKDANASPLFGVNNSNASNGTFKSVSINGDNITINSSNNDYTIPLRIYGITELHETEGELQQQIIALQEENQQLLESRLNEKVNLDLIWTNPYPSHYFVNGRVLTLPQITKYDYEYLVIDCKNNVGNSGSKVHRNFIPRNANGYRIFGNGDDNSFYNVLNTVTISGNNISFTNGSGGDYCIPLRIYGIVKTDTDEGVLRNRIEELEAENETLQTIVDAREEPSFEVLWENPEPNYNRGFETQTISIPNADEYVAYIVDVKRHKDGPNDKFIRNFCSKNVSNLRLVGVDQNNNSDTANKTITINGNNFTITSTNNDWGIPLKIWGIR